MKTWILSAERRNGRSVGHPCIDGVVTDPSEVVNDVQVEADSEADAIRQANVLIHLAVDAWSHGNCGRRYFLGDAWWASLVISATEVVERPRGQKETTIMDTRKCTCGGIMHHSSAMENPGDHCGEILNAKIPWRNLLLTEDCRTCFCYGTNAHTSYAAINCLREFRESSQMTSVWFWSDDVGPNDDWSGNGPKSAEDVDWEGFDEAAAEYE